MNRQEFNRILHPDLRERWQDHLHKPMMRQALLAIMFCREAAEKAKKAKEHNEAIRSRRIRKVHVSKE